MVYHITNLPPLCTNISLRRVFKKRKRPKSPITVCIVKGCQKKRKFQLPKNERLKLKWLQAVKRENSDVCETHGLCSDHFDPCFIVCTRYGISSQRVRLRNGAIPSRFSWTTIQTSTNELVDCHEEKIAIVNDEPTPHESRDSVISINKSNEDVRWTGVSHNPNAVWVLENRSNDIDEDDNKDNFNNDHKGHLENCTSASDDPDPLAISELKKDCDSESSTISFILPL
ncbi:hypothetical protein QAD02_022649 [Eretmocerus hayati]|uniref:Uncharacterized protein n=1 Tax=Eretmocerus hayati TaxID=131215 RepID=A0ACC2PTW9_9HYME|nr:hypothetical protein QAD02_022649 [Eretmocerus hayati]